MKIPNVIVRYGSRGKQELFNALMEHDVAMVTDAESVDVVSDYRDLINELLALADVALPPEAISFEEGTMRTIRVTDKGQDLVGAVKGKTDWVDDEKLLVLLNSVLETRGIQRQLWKVWDADLFGQDFGVVIANAAEAQALFDVGLPVFIADAQGQLPIVPLGGHLDGHRAIGYRMGASATRNELKVFAQQLAALTDGMLRLKHIKIDYERERMILDLPDRMQTRGYSSLSLPSSTNPSRISTID